MNQKMDPLKTIVSLLFVVVSVCNAAGIVSIDEGDLVESLQNSTRKFDSVFAKLINQNLKPEENALFSPLNIHVALSLLQLGTAGETRDELSSILEIPNNETESSKQHSFLGKVLNGLQNTDAAEVKIANSVFVQKGKKLKENYLKATQNYYKNEAQQVDFAKGGSEATDTINNWVSSNTKKRIPKLFKENISSDTRLLLASALLFNATWDEPFEKSLTKDQNFNTGLKQVAVKMMNQIDYVRYLKNENLQYEAISIPYKNNEFSMDIVLPFTSKTLGALINESTPEHQWQMLVDFHKANRTYVDYKLPRFKFDWTKNINEHVKKSGIQTIFTNSELSNLVEDSADLVVSNIDHATEIQVDEVGTVATAVTTVQVGYAVSIQPPKPKPIKFYVDRPFLFRIVSQKTAVTLFTGIVQNPAK
ncbi:serpin B3-like [Planococcus citri]|uniref:serpin B3-like n=1 Tax=Planococcus citri TaxID=170843 RepID=UPI0031F7FDA3